VQEISGAVREKRTCQLINHQDQNVWSGHWRPRFGPDDRTGKRAVCSGCDMFGQVA
jgi:hypothetical protein